MVSTRSSKRQTGRQTRSSTQKIEDTVTRTTTISSRATTTRNRPKTKTSKAKGCKKVVKQETTHEEEDDMKDMNEPMIPPVIEIANATVTATATATATATVTTSNLDRLQAQDPPKGGTSIENNLMLVLDAQVTEMTSAAMVPHSESKTSPEETSINTPIMSMIEEDDRKVILKSETKSMTIVSGAQLLCETDSLKYRKVSPASSESSYTDKSFDTGASENDLIIRQLVKPKIKKMPKSNAMINFENLMDMSSSDEDDRKEKDASQSEDEDLYDPNDGEHPENVWAKEARGYDSAYNNESEEYDSEEELENAFKGWFYKGTSGKRSRGGKRKVTRRNVPRKIKPLKMVERLPKLTLEEKQHVLDNITTLNENNDIRKVVIYKFFQCTLWDFGFLYTLLNHQFDAVFAVAGIDGEALMKMFDEFDEKDVALLLDLNKKGKMERKEICVHHVTFVETRGVLLADVMGLVSTISLRLCVLHI